MEPSNVMGWLTTLSGRRSRRMPFEDEATPETVRAEWMAQWMEEDRRPREEESHPPVLFRWVGHWTRWSQMSHTYEPLEGRLIPTTLVAYGNSVDPPPTEGDRFRFADGAWTRVAPDEPDEPPESPDTEPPADDEATGPDAVELPKPVLSSDLPPAKPIKDPAADQIAAWRRRIRRT